ncbi:MAG: sulfatase [Acidobacteria bacterium]|nr:sulfatase [Acidobacteriota bacterium]
MLALCLGTAVPLQAKTNRPPNFIVIFVDDMGYADAGAFGSKVHRTPNLDRMAKEGRKLTSFYVASSVCTPSRAALMTGSYPRRVGLHTSPAGSANPLVLFPGSSRGLNPDEVTLAEVLKKRGYATGIIGKWHLGDQPQFLPTRQGFDTYFGIPYSNDMGVEVGHSFPPLPLMRDEKVIEQEPDQSLLTQRYTQQAVQFIQRNKDNPFFLYLPHTMPHFPQYASERFKGKSANGIYGDTIEELDWSVGRILDSLRQLRIDENTFVLFTSDNGGVPAPILTYRGSNGPLRGWKGSTWEGGMRVLAIARWPGRIPSGTVTDEMILSTDMLPTFAKLAGAEVPSDRVIDGKDAWPVLAGAANAATPHDRFYYYQMGYLAAVRSGQWKLHVIRTAYNKDTKKTDMEDVLELYDLAKDIGETANVADRHPDVVRRLQAMLAEAREDIGDDQTKDAGKNVRPAGYIAMPKTLTRGDSSRK